MNKKITLGAIVIIVLILIVVAYYTLIYNTAPQSVTEVYKDYYGYLYNNMEDKVYPNYKIYNIKIDPPRIETSRLAIMGADENGFCVSCFSRATAIRVAHNSGFFYRYICNTYIDCLKEAGVYKIETSPILPATEGLNDFNYYITFDNITGIVNNINVRLDPSEESIAAMSIDEAKNLKNLIEEINVSSDYPALAGKSEICLWFHPWATSHNLYNITVPHSMINYTINDKSKCNTSVTSNGNKINIVADCGLYSSLCPSDPQQYDGLHKCDYPKIEVCFN